jgi:hypothetical protein
MGAYIVPRPKVAGYKDWEIVSYRVSRFRLGRAGAFEKSYADRAPI